MNGKMKEGLQPLLCEEPKILILGTFPSENSLEKKEYYSNPSNRFWKVISALFSPLPYTDHWLNSYEDKKMEPLGSIFFIIPLPFCFDVCVLSHLR